MFLAVRCCNSKWFSYMFLHAQCSLAKLCCNTAAKLWKGNTYFSSILLRKRLQKSCSFQIKSTVKSLEYMPDSKQGQHTANPLKHSLENFVFIITFSKPFELNLPRGVTSHGSYPPMIHSLIIQVYWINTIEVQGISSKRKEQHKNFQTSS